MKRFMMGLTVLILTAVGIIVCRENMNYYLQVLFLVMLLWSGIEFYIGFFRTFEGNSPSHSIVKLNRMMWPLFVVYSWLDFRYNWSKILLANWVLTGLLTLCVFGLVVRIWAVLHLGKSFSYDVKSPEGKVLVETGPYRLIRHPSYLGICILSSLPGLVVGSIIGFIGMTLVTIIHIVYRVNVEEKVLQTGFGSAFTEYKQRTYRILPFIY